MYTSDICIVTEISIIAQLEISHKTNLHHKLSLGHKINDAISYVFGTLHYSVVYSVSCICDIVQTHALFKTHIDAL